MISDDEDYLGENSTVVKPEEILDFSFTGDEWEDGDDEILVIEDDTGDIPEDPQLDSTKASGSSECLGNKVLAASVSLGTCTICGLLLLDTTKEVGVESMSVEFRTKHTSLG